VIARRIVLIPCGPANDFLVRTDKAVYRGGDTMKLTAEGGAGPVFVDLVKEGQTLLTETDQSANGQTETNVDLPADLSGTVQVVGYRVDAKGYPVRKTRVVYVRPADQVHIAATLDPRQGRLQAGRTADAASETDGQGRQAVSRRGQPGRRGRGRVLRCWRSGRAWSRPSTRWKKT